MNYLIELPDIFDFPVDGNRLLFKVNHFNDALFAGQLPQVMFVLQRSTKSMGHVSKNRWQNHQGRQLDELSVNPEFFLGRSILEVFCTLCHEMTHIWREHVSTEDRGRRFYHDKVWAKKMERIGLVPSDTGKPGGKKTGQKMADYPLVDSAFYVASMRLVYSNFMLPWLDMRPSRLKDEFAVYTKKGDIVDYSNREDRLMVAPIGYKPLSAKMQRDERMMNDEIAQDANAIIAAIFGRPADSSSLIDTEEDLTDEMFAEQIKEFSSTTNLRLSDTLWEGFSFSQEPTFEEKKQTRAKYTCSCGDNVWGRPGLEIMCCDCDELFKSESTVSTTATPRTKQKNDQIK